MLPPKDQLKICFAHPAYRMAERFVAREGGIDHVQASTVEGLAAEIPQADVVVVSQMWRNHLVAGAPKLRFIQSISAGADQYDQQLLRARRDLRGPPKRTGGAACPSSASRSTAHH